MTAIAVPIKCPRCQRFSPAEEFVGAGHGFYCWRCYEKHMTMLAEFRGVTQCYECQVKVVGDRPGEQLTCRLVPKDGVYQLLCELCFDKWMRLVPEMFKGTPFGKAMNL